VTTATRLVQTPGEAAARLGITTAALTALLRRHRYEFTELVPGGKPGDRGRHRWGLTEPQVQAILRGQARALPDPAALDTAAPQSSPVSPDGKRRLKGRRTRA
jgi:hypothetical protein